MQIKMVQTAVVAQRGCRGAHEGCKACSAISAINPFTGQHVATYASQPNQGAG